MTGEYSAKIYTRVLKHCVCIYTKIKKVQNTPLLTLLPLLPSRFESTPTIAIRQ